MILPTPDDPHFREVIKNMKDEDIELIRDQLKHNITAYALRAGRGDHGCPHLFRHDLEKYKDIEISGK